MENIDHIITKHNALCEHLKEREGEKPNNPLAQRDPAPNWDLTDRNPKLPETLKTITLPKPEWWDKHDGMKEEVYYMMGLEAASKAFGVIIKLED